MELVGATVDRNHPAAQTSVADGDDGFVATGKKARAERIEPARRGAGVVLRRDDVHTQGRLDSRPSCIAKNLAPRAHTFSLHSGLLDLQRLAGNRAVTSFLRIQRIQAYDDWRGQNNITWISIKKYFNDIVLPAIKAVVAQDSEGYAYLKDMYLTASKEWVDKSKTKANTPAMVFTAYLNDHVVPLVECIAAAEQTLRTAQEGQERKQQAAESEKTERARLAALRGDGGFPIGMKRGSGESTILVVRNDVHPDNRGYRYVVWLEHHQNKHQSLMIPELSQWGGTMGTTFNNDIGLAWHTSTTALWARDYVVKHAGSIPAQGVFTPNKTDAVDNRQITYDITAWLEDGVRHLSYHCNPSTSLKSQAGKVVTKE